MTTQLLLTRHGQTFWNLEGRFQGQLNSDLTELGVKQAIALGKYLEDINIDIIFSSDLSRAVHTAELIRNNKNCEIITSPNIREMYLDRWQGRLFEDVKNEEPVELDVFKNKPQYFSYYNAETFYDLLERTSNFIEDVVKKYEGKQILVVTHGLVLKVLRLYFLNLGICELNNYPTSPASTGLTVVENIDGLWKLLKWNKIDHYKYIL